MYHFSLVDTRLFLAIADEQNLTRGAQRVFLSTSSASARLKNLEEELGVKLFEREARGLTLTTAGMILYRHAKAQTSLMVDLENALAPYAHREQGIVRIVANYGASIDYLPKDIAQFMAKHRQVQVVLEQMPSPKVVEAVREGQADFGVCVSSNRYPELRFDAYREDRLVLVTPEQHPLAHYDALQFSQTLSWDFVSLVQGSAMQQFLFEHARTLGQPIKPRIQVDNQLILLELVKAGVGIGVISEQAFRQNRSDGLKAIALTDAWASRHLQLVSPVETERLTPYSIELRDFLLKRSQPKGL